MTACMTSHKWRNARWCNLQTSHHLEIPLFFLVYFVTTEYLYSQGDEMCKHSMGSRLAASAHRELTLQIEVDVAWFLMIALRINLVNISAVTIFLARVVVLPSTQSRHEKSVVKLPNEYFEEVNYLSSRSFSGPECPGEKRFSMCGAACAGICPALLPSFVTPSTLRVCSEVCVDGCSCPLGLLEGPNSTCVTLANCPCILNGTVAAAGQEIIYDDHRWWVAVLLEKLLLNCPFKFHFLKLSRKLNSYIEVLLPCW